MKGPIIMRELLRAFAVLLTLISAGCDKSPPVVLDPETEEELAEFDRQLEVRDQEYVRANKRINDPNVVVASHSVEASPASLPDDTDTGLRIESSPEDVCREFLSALQREDRDTARQLLTTVAQVETTRAHLELDAPGDAQTEFSVMQARYATLEQMVAEVDCLFHRNDYRGESVKLTWMMRRQTNGWKIYGMLIDMGSGQLDLLSFENAIDLARIQQSVTE